MKPFRSFVPPLAAMLMAASGGASAQGVLIDRSEIRFVGRETRGAVEGTFRKWRANVDFRPKNLAQSKAEFEIELASIALASEEKEAEVRRPVWFDTAKFPVARFTSSAMKNLGGDRYEIAGRLSIKGVTRDVVIPMVAAQGWRGQQRRRKRVRVQSARLQDRRRPVGRHQHGGQRSRRAYPDGAAAGCLT